LLSGRELAKVSKPLHQVRAPVRWQAWPAFEASQRRSAIRIGHRQPALRAEGQPLLTIHIEVCPPWLIARKHALLLG
jgi:hypothetical protein